MKVKLNVIWKSALWLQMCTYLHLRAHHLCVYIINRAKSEHLLGAVLGAERTKQDRRGPDTRCMPASTPQLPPPMTTRGGRFWKRRLWGGAGGHEWRATGASFLPRVVTAACHWGYGCGCVHRKRVTHGKHDRRCLWLL